MTKRDRTATPWRAPTRRAFVAMIGAAATALAIERPARRALDTDDTAEPPRSTWSGTTRWIGHC